jgi:hypothetical protein
VFDQFGAHGVHVTEKDARGGSSEQLC